MKHCVNSHGLFCVEIFRFLKQISRLQLLRNGNDLKFCFETLRDHYKLDLKTEFYRSLYN
ncbi:hypothetical protein LEP1GSC073_3775 [Leptospira noguchii str. Cascata]|nr:hypothetical protein LEP1GSC072_3745 [Leptospira noguchii str. Bonito]EMS89340.1 hypothetical protein LEP1GSC073_3775 [Leptospira noguchii str. Cascata]